MEDYARAFVDITQEFSSGYYALTCSRHLCVRTASRANCKHSLVGEYAREVLTD